MSSPIPSKTVRTSRSGNILLSAFGSRRPGTSSPVLPVFRSSSSDDDAKGLDKMKKRGWLSGPYFRFIILTALIIFIYNYIFTTKQPNSSLAPAILNPVNDSSSLIPSETWTSRSNAVKSAFSHAWKGYSTYAMGADELRPLSRTPNTWLHLSLTLFDALDTALLMNHTNIYTTASTWLLSSNFTMDADVNANVFETTIRVLGGLLSAYHMTHNDALKSLALRVGEKLLPAFSSSSGLPSTSIHLKSGAPSTSYYDVSLAEATSVQMEMKYLTHVTGDTRFWDAGEKVMRVLDGLTKVDGLAPIYLGREDGMFKGDIIMLGSHGDSYYEYLGKLFLLTNLTETGHLRQYHESLTGIKRHLLMRSTPNNLLYVQELPFGLHSSPSPKMDHLVCFLPGTIALLATKGRRIPTHERTRLLSVEDQVDLHIAEEIARTCVEMYKQTKAGLAAEISFFRKDPMQNTSTMAMWVEGLKRDIGVAKTEGRNYVPVSGVRDGERTMEMDFEIHKMDGHNLLRPETVESLFVLWKWAKVKGGGYASLGDVRVIPPPKRDHMESFFLGETLKYLYLLFCEQDLVPLDKYVFNTEAHPLPVFELDEEMRKKVVMVDP
ncbi:glycoside hydrolase [Chytridium lagenaria]|nr:glycoside hydrolase [Chytridium lagenaria]